MCRNKARGLHRAGDLRGVGLRNGEGKLALPYDFAAERMLDERQLVVVVGQAIEAARCPRGRRGIRCHGLLQVEAVLSTAKTSMGARRPWVCDPLGPNGKSVGFVKARGRTDDHRLAGSLRRRGKGVEHRRGGEASRRSAGDTVRPPAERRDSTRTAVSYTHLTLP